MNVAGIIVEYNPFHNGHYYHIQETKKVTGADVVVAVMSGNFLQRGEPALVSKWSRTKMALLGGVDIVVELPYAFATQKAEIFASGAIALLNALQVDHLCFGSEIGEITAFYDALQMFENNEEQFTKVLKSSLKEGKSYPRAASDAFRSLEGSNSRLNLSQPNNILGFHYVKALKASKSKMIASTIQRKAAHYHDQKLNDEAIASATSVRHSLFANDSSDLAEIKRVIPATTYEQLVTYKHNNGMFHNWESYFPFLKYRLLSMSAFELKSIYEVEEGLENRILHSISTAHSFQQFMEKIKTKRYTRTRLQRLCIHILTNTTKQQMQRMRTPEYIRLLGVTTSGQNYLNKIKKDLALPIVAKLSAFTNEQLNHDIKAAYIYACCLQEPAKSQMIKAEFAQPPFRYDQVAKQFL